MENKKTKIIIFVLLIILGGVTIKGYTANRPDSNYVFSDLLSEEDIDKIQKPVTMTTIEQIVDKVTFLRDIGSGRTIYEVESEKYGPLVLYLENNSDVDGGLEIMKCVVSNSSESYVLFGKYKSKAMNE